MNKNLLGAIVVFFITFASLLVFNEVSSNNAPETEKAQLYVTE